MDIDIQSSPGGYIYRVLETPGSSGVHADGRIHVIGMITTSDDGSEVKLWLINDHPSVDSVTGELLDNEVMGANATIEVFSTKAIVSVHYRVRECMKTGLSTTDDAPAFQRCPAPQINSTATGVYLQDIVDGPQSYRKKTASSRSLPYDEHGFGYRCPRL